MSVTPSGEVAQFVDDDQFGSGQSQDKCGPEAVALFWHSTAPGTHNPYTSADVHAMAHTDYTRFIGPDDTADTGGTSNALLYHMLSAHNFHYCAIPTNLSLIKAFLHVGYPVIIGVEESSVDDLGIGGSPYSWNTSGLSHVITATGAGATGEILVRDTANIAPTGVRPGPRHYNSGKLQLLSATVCVPSWLPDIFTT